MSKPQKQFGIVNWLKRLNWWRRPSKDVSISDINYSDNPIESEGEDQFGFQDYASVLADRVESAETPITIGVYGGWGTGKSSLMNLVDDELAKRKEEKGISLETLWINVWQLSNQEEIWHAFLQALFNKVRKKLPPLRRIEWKKLISMLFRNAYRIVVVITPIILGGMIGKPGATWDDFWKLIFDPFSMNNTIAAGGTLLSYIMSLWILVKPAIETARDVVNFDLRSVLKFSSYEVQISELMDLKRKFQNLVRALVGNDGRLIIFIDDLDRCTPDSVPEVLESIKLFTTIPGCVYVLGLDADVVRQGIQRKYGFTSEIQAAEYLEKLLQIPFHLPPLEPEHIIAFINKEYGEEIKDISPDVFAFGLERNPRKVKRALNVYRTLLNMAEIRVKTVKMDPVEPELVAKMVVIQSRFRNLYTHLTREPGRIVELETWARGTRRSNENLTKEDQEKITAVTSAIDVWLDDNDIVPERTRRALGDMLLTGKASFEKLEISELTPYIYLTGTASPEGVSVEAPADLLNEILGDETEKVDKAIARIVNREPEGEGPIHQGLREQLVRALSDSNWRVRERLRAGEAMARLCVDFPNPNLWVLPQEIQIKISEILDHGVEEQAHKLINQSYLERLKKVMKDTSLYSDVEVDLVEKALKYLEGSLPVQLDNPPPSVVADLSELSVALDADIPKKVFNKNLIIGSWNIRGFGGLTTKWVSGPSDSPKRDLGSLLSIAGIVSRFDVLIIKELRGNLEALRYLLQQLGPNWGYVSSGEIPSVVGNAEKIAYVFDTTRLRVSGQAGELTLPEDVAKGIDTRRLFFRPPYTMSFVANEYTIVLVNLEVLYGVDYHQKDRFMDILAAAASFFRDLAKNNNAKQVNTLFFGDFNNERSGDVAYDAFINTGLIVPDELQPQANSAISGGSHGKFLDQVAWFTSTTGEPLISLAYRRGAVFDFTQVALKSRNLNMRELSYRISDHLPVWVEFELS